MIDFCAIIAFGPGQIEAERVRDLLDSLWTYEPLTPLVLLVDDSGQESNVATALHTPPQCRLVTLQNPRHGRGVGATSGLSAGMLSALAWIERHAPEIAFVVKLDTDGACDWPVCHAD